MNEEFRRALSEILAAALPEDFSGRALEFKPCFGAVAGYVDGKLFVSYGKFGLALKLPPGPRAELLEHKGGTPLRYFPKGHVKKEYVVIPRGMLEGRAHLPRAGGPERGLRERPGAMRPGGPPPSNLEPKIGGGAE